MPEMIISGGSSYASFRRTAQNSGASFMKIMRKRPELPRYREPWSLWGLVSNPTSPGLSHWDWGVGWDLTFLSFLGKDSLLLLGSGELIVKDIDYR